MSICSVSSSNSSSWGYVQNGFSQSIQDFKALETAVQSGDPSSAQQALAAFQQDLQNNPNSPLAKAIADPNSQIGKDFQALQSAVQSGDTTSAQSALAALQQDLKAAHTHHHHHHHGSDGDSNTNTQAATDSSSTTTTSPTLGTVLNEQA